MRRLICVILCLAGCSGGSSDGADETQTPSEAHASTVTTVGVEIDYASGAEPYTGSAARVDDIWSLSQVNIQRLFQNKTIVLPHTLEDMEELTDIDGEDFDSAAIQSIADRHRDQWLPSDTTAAFYIVWLNGYFAQDGVRQSNVLGVTLGNTGILAMFKPVIASTGTSALPSITRFVEQTTVVHEMGHAAGLVNNGVPAIAAHQDTDHGAHCTNESCVMYYLNEGVADIVEYASTYATSGSSVLFDSDCLADVDASEQ